MQEDDKEGTVKYPRPPKAEEMEEVTEPPKLGPKDDDEGTKKGPPKPRIGPRDDDEGVMKLITPRK